MSDISSIDSTSTSALEDDRKRTVVVECVNEKKIEMIVKGKERFGELNERVAKESDVLAELSFLCIVDKEIHDSRTMDEMDVSDGCVIVQKMSPLGKLLKPDTLTPSIVSYIMEYVEKMEILKLDKMKRKMRKLERRYQK
jgi:hypothetical protein